MSKAALLLVGGAALAALLGPGGGRAHACSCDVSPPPQEELATAAAVFQGTVRDMANSAVQIGPIRMIDVEFEVVRYWKGDVGPRLKLVTAWSEISCGVEFDLGGSYLVYALDTRSGLLASFCSRTTSTDRAASDLAALGPGSPPAPLFPLGPTGGGCSAGGGRSAEVGGSAMPLVGLLWLGTYRWRRRRFMRTARRAW